MIGLFQVFCHKDMRGTIDTIIYKGNDNFIICAITTNDVPEEYRSYKSYDSCIVKGNMSVVENLEYEFTGKWVNDARYGWQLNVTSYKEITPDGTNPYALLVYLQSEMFSGVGEKTAKNIIKKFGKDTLDIIKNDHLRLAEVSGISKKKAETIYQSYLKNYEYQEIMMLLKPYGVSTKRILRIMEHYGSDAIDTIKNNPYDICKKIDGFGFLIADKIAMASFTNRRDVNRIKEAIKYALDQSAMEKGNLYLTKSMLGQKLSEIVNKDLKSFVVQSLKRKGIENITKEDYERELRENFVNTEDVLCALKTMHEEGEIVLEYPNVRAKQSAKIFNDENLTLYTCNEDDEIEIISYDQNNVYYVKYQDYEGKMSTNDLNDVDFDCYLKYYYNAEVNIAKNINRLLYSTSTKPFSGSFNDIISKLEQKNNITYADKQKEAIMSILKRNVVVITGGPGTGKTTLIKGVIALFDTLYPNDEILLVAPTGRAAKRMEETTGVSASTIHRLLEYNPGQGFVKNADNPIDADLIIVDETSMVDAVLCNAFLKAIANNTKIAFVGDADQLPSVGPGMVLKSFIESKKITTIFLNEIFRQATTSKIVINAQKINAQDTQLEFGSEFAFHRIEREEHPNLQEDVVKELCKVYEEQLKANDFDLNKVQVLVPFRAKRMISVVELNKILAPIANPRPANEISLNTGLNLYHIGDKVMQLKNNYDKQVFNGDIGYVRNIIKTFNGYILQVEYDSNIVAYDEFDEITLAYASTIHKSQGSEYDVVIQPILMEQSFFLQKCIVYTAITRAKKKFIGIGEYKALMTAISKNTIINRNTKLAKRIDEYSI